MCVSYRDLHQCIVLRIVLPLLPLQSLLEGLHLSEDGDQGLAMHAMVVVVAITAVSVTTDAAVVLSAAVRMIGVRQQH